MKNLAEEVREDFLRFLLEHLDPEECWVWQGSVDTNGYGIYLCEGQSLQAHRSAAILFGERAILPKMKIYHVCSNRLCCNPYHIRIRDRITQYTYDCMSEESMIPEQERPRGSINE